jgi:hypothetical protein
MSFGQWRAPQQVIANTDARAKRARKILVQKGLPDAHLEFFAASPGAFCHCESCGEAIEDTQIGYELQFRQIDRCITLNFHRHCYDDVEV